MYSSVNACSTVLVSMIFSLTLSACGKSSDIAEKHEVAIGVDSVPNGDGYGGENDLAEVEGTNNTNKEKIDFHRDIRPILDNKCVACHACYDAPCQLKLESDEGLIRGASKVSVYNGGRLKTISPTRLHVDANSESQWRKKGFFDVLARSESPPIMKNMLELGRSHGFAVTQDITKDDLTLGPDRELSCVNQEEFTKYAKDRPRGGMPLAVAGLTEREFQTLSRWLDDGAPVAAVKAKILDQDQRTLAMWEHWLNAKVPEQQLVSRYIYEHLILGNLYLSSDANTAERLADTSDTAVKFFRIVRSKTPPGSAIEVMATTLPNSPPQGDFYYRLQAVNETIVYKNHIPYRFDKARMEAYQNLFFNEKFTLSQLPGYSYEERANPFVTFADIPAKARYRFLLQDAEYFIRNFIRGPVCHGPIATDVIRDQFWTMFEAPDRDLYVNNKAYRDIATPLLGLPGEKDELSDLGTQWEIYSDSRNEYLKLRQQYYNTIYKRGASRQDIWTGEGQNPNAFLTVFRHHNSASVTKGWRGDIPRTAWVLDYPLFERTYYELVVGFNVFGSVSHQLQTRLYFDLIRNGGERNFLRFMPTQKRKDMYDSWYQGSGKLKVMTSYYPLDAERPTAVSYQTSKPKREFFDMFFDAHPKLTKAADPINRCPQNCRHGAKLKQLNADNSAAVQGRYGQLLSQVASQSAKTLPVVKFLPDLTLLSVRPDTAPKGEAQSASSTISAFTIIRNRMHSNVAFMLGESLRYQEDQDTLTVLPEIVGSYPNLMLSVGASELPSMINKLVSIKSDKEFKTFIDNYGVRRMQARFWDELHGFTAFLDAVAPLESGVLDINRYGYW